MKFAIIALRNLARNRRRTLLSLLIVASGTVVALLTSGFIRFSFEGLREAIIHGGLGHIEVAPADDLQAGGSSALRSGLPHLTGWKQLRGEVESTPHVLAAGAVVQFTGMISRQERSAAVLALATEPDRERRMHFEVRMRGGTDLPDAPPAEADDGVLLGTALATTLDARQGDCLLYTSDAAD